MIAILDYGSGNLRSAQRAFETSGKEVVLTSDYDIALNADGLVVPGVGAFAACMQGLAGVRGDQLVRERIALKRPTLGICVGMQILFSHGVEHGNHDGVGVWDATVEQLDAPILPHMGWNNINLEKKDPLFDNLDSNSLFYFLHSYYFECYDKNDILASSAYGVNFSCAIRKNNIYGVQFHPEKSHLYGIELLNNFAKLK